MNCDIPFPLDLASPASESLTTRRSLLSRLRNLGDDASWRVFFDTYWRLMYNVARKAGLTDADAQDVVQETVIAVARRMPEFRYDAARGSFKQWLMVITRRRIQDHLRRVYRSNCVLVSSGEATAGIDNATSPVESPDMQLQAAWESEWQETLRAAALVRVRQRCAPKQYQVFDCCVLQGLGSSEVARMLGLSMAQVYLAKHRVGRAVRRAMSDLEAERNRTSAW